MAWWSPWSAAATEMYENLSASLFPAERAYQLMRDNLSDDQRKDYDKNHSFVAIGSATGTKYRVKMGFQMNIFIEEIGDLTKLDFHCDLRKTTRLCIAPMGVPIGDIMLAQKIILECDEPIALKTARKHHVTHAW